MLSGEYQPPFGVVGEAFDAVIGKRIAEATAKMLLETLQQELEADFSAVKDTIEETRQHDLMLRVGLTGGIGSGKSEVARIFAQLGATIIDADQLAREVVVPGTPGFDAIAERWPHVIRDGVHRSRRAGCDRFCGCGRARSAERHHSPARTRACRRARSKKPATASRCTSYRCLFEGDYWKECDATVVVIAPVETRIARVQARDGMSREDVVRRMAAQIDPDVARRERRTLSRTRERALIWKRHRARYGRRFRIGDYQTPGQTGR